MRVELHRLGQPPGLQEERHGVDPEPGQPLGQPEPDHLADLLAHRIGGDVEVRLGPVEAMHVVLAGVGVERPDAVLVAGEHLALRAVGRDLVLPDVVVPEAGLPARPGRLEPRVLVGGVVDDEVGDDPHAPVGRRPHELREVAERPEPGIDAVVVGDVVPVVHVGGRVERHQPQARDPRGRRGGRGCSSGRRSHRCRPRRSRRTSGRRGSRRRRSSTRGRRWRRCSPDGQEGCPGRPTGPGRDRCGRRGGRPARPRRWRSPRRPPRPRPRRARRSTSRPARRRGRRSGRTSRRPCCPGRGRACWWCRRSSLSHAPRRPVGTAGDLAARRGAQPVSSASAGATSSASCRAR